MKSQWETLECVLGKEKAEKFIALAEKQLMKAKKDMGLKPIYRKDPLIELALSMYADAKLICGCKVGDSCSFCGLWG